jgi:hypothetical protein
MAKRIRVLDSANRAMQRLGYLKPLCALANKTETSNLETLGKRLIERVTKRVVVSPPLDAQTREYVKNRLTHRSYQDLRNAVLEPANSASVRLEIQDFYLADARLPSRTGKLAEASWRRYPYLGMSLDLIRKGTYSPLTRSLVLLALTPGAELRAFDEPDRVQNPFRITDAQAAVLLYCLIDNDAEVLQPFFAALLSRPGPSFDEREVSVLLRDIFRQIERTHRNQSTTVEERSRLTLLVKTAASIDKRKRDASTGGGAAREAVTVRLEPFCDLGFFTKPDRDRFTYCASDRLRAWAARWQQARNTDEFLRDCFFTSLAATRGLPTRPVDEELAIAALVAAGEELKSPLGYSPITDVALLAAARLADEQLVLEIGRATELLKALQKRDPAFVRFTVDRMGTLAYVKFLKPAPEAVT